MKSNDELTFVFLGKKLPKYARASLQLACKSSDVKVCLIGNASLISDVAGLPINFLAVEDFYDPKPFLKASARVWSDHNFRGGLWLKSLERLFVIQQYMRLFSKKELLHAELDQFIFRPGHLLRHLKDLSYLGLFTPLHGPNSAVASILFVNNISALDSLLDYAANESYFSNEMQLIADWAKSHADAFFELPTAASFYRNRTESLIENVRLLSVSDVGGLVDAAQLGQWLAGIDPKNVGIRSRPLTKFVDSEENYLLNASELQSLKFELSQNSLKVTNRADAEPLMIYNLHIHSKIHMQVLKGKLPLDQLLSAASSPERIELPGTRFQQLSYWLQVWVTKIFSNPHEAASAVQMKLSKWVGLRPSSRPFLSGDSFRAVADFVWESERGFSAQDLKVGSVVFCESDLLEELNEKVLNQIDFPVVLLLGNSDREIGEEHIRMLNLAPKSSIFAQNLNSEVLGVTPLPIGLENRWRSKNGRRLPFLILPIIKHARVNKVLWGFSVATNQKVRSRAALSLLKSPVAVHAGTVSAGGHRQLLSKYKFVASPPGNGIDTHRTWEAMYLGCIPIITDSYLSRFYKSLGLPVWVIGTFEELLSIGERDLEIKYDQIMNSAEFEDLWLSSWIKRVEVARALAKN